MKVERRHHGMLLAALAAAGVLCAWSPASAGPRQPKQKDKAARVAAGARRLAEEKSGSLTTREGLRLRLVTDQGNVRILTADSGPSAVTVTYRVSVETDSREADAQDLLKQFSVSASSNPAGTQITGQVPWHGFHGRLRVNYEVTVPRRYNLDVTTQVGNIETQDVDGRVSLITMGGNITAGRIGGPEGAAHAMSIPGVPVARLETQGGHITVQDVNGDLRAITAGGHINAGNIAGEAVLRTGGGNIRAGTIHGVAQIETGGGNIAVQRAGGSVSASSAGGQIDFGEAAGSIRAHTGGGAIRVLHVAGPMQLASSSGSIFLTQVRGNVHASTGAGTITAWFMPESGVWVAAPAVAARSGVPPRRPAPPTPLLSPEAGIGGVLTMPALAPKMWKLAGDSQLEAAQGDIVVYIPRELAVTIEAVVEMGGEHRIEADPALPIKVRYVDSGSGTKAVKGECTLNGGGDVLRLKTTSGNIRLKVADNAAQEALHRRQFAEVERRLAVAQQRMQEQFKGEEIQAQVEAQQQLVKQMTQMAEQQQKQAEKLARQATRTWVWDLPWVEALTGGMTVDPEEQQKKLISSVRPGYPDLAQQAGIEGTVRLRVLVGKDGAVQSVRVLSGDGTLAAAAMDAVKQWRYQPTQVDGKPVSVVTTVAIRFKLE